MTTGYGPFGSSLRDLPRLRPHRRRRESSWDRTGGNADFITLRPGDAATIAELTGAGSVNHIWMTCAIMGGGQPGSLDNDYLQKLILRVYWDNSEHPSILVPLGDFFGVGHAASRNFVSHPLQMSPQDGNGLNCWFHMPFATGARFEIESECVAEEVRFYYYIDYDAFDELEDGLGRFHASWNRRRGDEAAGRERSASLANEEFLFGGHNTTGAGNYPILQTTGTGHYVGCVFNVVNRRETPQWNWYGEGDDMIFVDGEAFPPSLHGTGTEDYFNTAWCPSQEYNAPYHGITMPGGPNWSGKISMYRFHIEDPVTFETEIRVTIEAGHDNRRFDDISSTAYWYQLPVATDLTLPPRPWQDAQ